MPDAGWTANNPIRCLAGRVRWASAIHTPLPMRHLLARAVRPGLLLACSVSAAFAQADTSRLPARDTTRARSLAVITVTGRADDLIGVASTASQGHIGSDELRVRPLTREGELLEAVPGLIVTQHSGDGKANQYFIRGFNLDHGTDFQTRLEGMPINSPTHAHGQGFTDLNFLIPQQSEKRGRQRDAVDRLAAPVSGAVTQVIAARIAYSTMPVVKPARWTRAVRSADDTSIVARNASSVRASVPQ
jgi:hypothetical protein